MVTVVVILTVIGLLHRNRHSMKQLPQCQTVVLQPGGFVYLCLFPVQNHFRSARPSNKSKAQSSCKPYCVEFSEGACEAFRSMALTLAPVHGLLLPLLQAVNAALQATAFRFQEDSLLDSNRLPHHTERSEVLNASEGLPHRLLYT